MHRRHQYQRVETHSNASKDATHQFLRQSGLRDGGHVRLKRKRTLASQSLAASVFEKKHTRMSNTADILMQIFQCMLRVLAVQCHGGIHLLWAKDTFRSRMTPLFTYFSFGPYLINLHEYPDTLFGFALQYSVQSIRFILRGRPP